jgi:hypothetical protein
VPFGLSFGFAPIASRYLIASVEARRWCNSAKAEINQVIKQIRGAQIRTAIAQKEYTNHQTQMANAQQVVDFLEGNPVDGFR